jgi:phospholipase D-like protein
VRRLVTLDLWPQLGRLASKAQRRMAAVAYVTRAVEVRFGDRDLLVVDASDQAIKSGVTAASVLRAAHKRGAQVFSCPGLHAKVLLLDDVAVIGSANISATSVNLKIEAALITDDRATVSKARSLIVKLAHQSHPIDEVFLRRIGKIKVFRKRPESSGEFVKERAGRQRANRAVVHELAKHGVRLDNPRVLSFRGKTFAFTGIFLFGTQDECARATRALGGRRSPSGDVTGRVDVLVVGTGGSPAWLWKTYGLKMDRANKLRRQWGKPLIVSEYRWSMEIGR